MELFEQRIKEYISRIEIPDEVKPENIKAILERTGEMTAGVFLKNLKELRISGSEFLELLGNSRIGNVEFRQIEENPHLKFDELLQILDNSVLTSDDYHMMISVALEHRNLREQRRRREQAALQRLQKEQSEKKQNAVQQTHREEEARLQAQREEEARLQAQREEEARLQAQREEEARLQAQREEEARLQAQREEEARIQAQREEEARLQAQREEEARLQAQREEEARLQAQREEEARLQAQREEEARRLQEQRSVHTEAETGTYASIAMDIPDELAQFMVGAPSVSAPDSTAPTAEPEPEPEPEEQAERRYSAAEEILKRAQAEIDSMMAAENDETEPSESVENVKTEDNITNSNTDLSDNREDKTAQDGGSHENGGAQSEDRYEKPADEPAADSDSGEKTGEPETAERTERGEDTERREEGENVPAAARDIDPSFYISFDDDDEDEEESDEQQTPAKTDGEPAPRRAAACIVTAFILAVVLAAGSFALKALRYYGILPETEDVGPTVTEQVITDFTSLLVEAKNAEGKVSYALPQEFAKREWKSSAPMLEAAGGDVLVKLVQNGDSVHACAIKTADGVLGDVNSFNTRLDTPSVIFLGGSFVLFGTDADNTVIRVYDEKTLFGDGDTEKEYIQSGKLVGYYTDGVAFYTVTEKSFSLDAAVATDLKSFVPAFEYAGSKNVVPLADIIRPKTVNKLSYYTVSRIAPESGDAKVKAVLCGENGGCVIAGGSLCACSVADVNKKYESQLVRISFDEKLSHTEIDTDMILNPAMLAADENWTAAAGIVTGEDESKKSCIARYDAKLDNSAVMTDIAGGGTVSDAYVNSGILTLTAGDEQPLQYNISLENMSMAQSAGFSIPVKPLSDGKSISAAISSDADGGRSGIALTVYDAENNTLTQLDVTVEGQSEYLRCAAAEDISRLAVSADENGALIGLPLTYFDGISQVSEFRFYRYEKDKLSDMGKIVLYDKSYEDFYCAINCGASPYIITMWDNRIITADTAKAEIISDVSMSLQANAGTDNSTASDGESSAEDDTDSAEQSEQPDESDESEETE